MWRMMLSGFDEYRIVASADRFCRDEDEWIARSELLRFDNDFAGESFLSGLFLEHRNILEFRDFLYRDLMCLDVSWLDDGQIRRRLVELLVDRRVLIFRLRRPGCWGLFHDQPAVDTAVQSLGTVARTEKPYIGFRVVDKATNRSIPGGTYTVTLPDGKDLQSSADIYGKVEINEIIDGKCTLQSDITGARIENTLMFEDIDQFPIDDEIDLHYEGDVGPEPKLARVEICRVKTGDTLESLSARAGMSWQELCEFNWGTSSLDEINAHLRDEVGCVNRTSDGKNMFFDDNDVPGIVYLPYPIKKTGLYTGAAYHLRVRPMAVAYDYGYQKEKHWVKLQFSVKGVHPKDLRVRLYECKNALSVKDRMVSIQRHALRWLDKAGLEKSGRYRRLQKSETIQSVAEKHGITNCGFILSHSKNRMLCELRGGPEAVREGDVVYIPEKQTIEPIPLGDLVPAIRSKDKAPGGVRYEAVWDIEKNGYDPLAADNWIPAFPASMSMLDEESGSIHTGDLYLPQFAILTPDFKVLGVAPTPLRLLHTANLQSLQGSKRLRALDAGGMVMEMRGIKEKNEFRPLDEPFGFVDDLFSTDVEEG